MKKKKIYTFLILSFFVVLLVLNFSTNYFSSKDEMIGIMTFEKFQSDSEYDVFSKIYSNKFGKNLGSLYGMSVILDKDGNSLFENIHMNSFDESYTVTDYTSQIGLQGHIFNFLYNKLNIPFSILKIFCCLSLAIVLVLMCYLISKKYNNLLGCVFYFTFLLSPWIVAFARNLYWVEFTWFLPMLFGLMLSMNYSKKKIFVPLIFFTILIKCMCGYEYITTVMLSSVVFFIIDFFNKENKIKRKEIIKTILIVGIACLLAFMICIVMHAYLKGNGNIIDGLKNIWKNDVLRRTIISYGKNNYSGLVRESIDASVWTTVSKYLTTESNILLGIEGKYFKFILLLVFLISCYNIIKREKNGYADIIMLIIFMISSLSWHILGKSHSYIHTHMNFVLWYFGFMQMCFYIIIKFVSKVIYRIGNKY